MAILGTLNMTDDRLMRFDAAGAPVRARRYAPQCDNLLDMEGGARAMGISRRSLERLLADPDWVGPRPFSHPTPGRKKGPRKQPFKVADINAYLDAMALRQVSAAERSSESAFAEIAWRDRDADVAWLTGRPALGGVARMVLERFGDDPADAPLRDALLHLSPTVVQCIPAIAERWRAAMSAGSRSGARQPGMMGSGGMTDSCYMWRRDGFLAKRIEGELRAFREGGAARRS